MKKLKIALIGGDMRQLAAARYFISKGHSAVLYGFNISTPTGLDFGKTLAETVENADCVVLPLPYGKDGRLNCPMTKEELTLDTLLSKAKYSIITGGKFDEYAYSASDAHKHKMIDYYRREELSVLNAIPTAEGTVEIMMHELPITVFGMNVAIVGYGRVGWVLSKTLRALGANVSVFARKADARARARIEGCNTYDMAKLPEKAETVSCLINTVPARVIDAGVISRLDKSCLILDLASAPGGVDTASSELYGVRCITALSLPGRAAPDTAGTIIAETVLNILYQEEIL